MGSNPQAVCRFQSDSKSVIRGVSNKAISSGVGTWNLSNHRPKASRSMGWLLQAPPLNPIEKNVRRRRQIMQFNRSAKGSGAEPQSIPLGPSTAVPRSSRAFLHPKRSSERASIQSSAEKRTAWSLLSSALASVVLPAPGEPAHNNQSRSRARSFHKEIIPDGCCGKL